MQDLRKRLIPILKNEVKNFIKDNFKNESFEGEKWEKRSSKDRSDRRNPDRNRRLLTKTGRLSRSIKVQTTNKGVVISSDTSYAQIHNEGGTINHPGGTPYVSYSSKFSSRKRKGRIRNMSRDSQMVFLKKDGDYPEGVKFTKPHKISMPERRFIGQSKVLEKRLEKVFEKEIEDFLNQKFKEVFQ